MPDTHSVSRPDEGQSLAIHHGAGPLLVLAGPGSGKTYVITHRIRYLISECRIPPNEILVITFTKAAALEMQARANSLIRQSVYVQFGTFHSIFYQILKKSREHCNFTLVSDKERRRFIKEVLETMEDKEENPEMQADRYLKAISQSKNMLPEKGSISAKKKESISTKEKGSISAKEKESISVKEKGGISTKENKKEDGDRNTKDNIEERASRNAKESRREKESGKRNRDAESIQNTERKKVEKVRRIYDEWLKETQKLDFDDMLRLCYFYLRDNPEEREKWQKRFSYILIDEFQDINPLQYETIKLLSGNGNFFAVGDDDQAIYGFRGSDPFMMKQFERELGAEVVRLSVNYRCSGRITEAAGRFISHNRNRFSKEIVPFKERGEEIYIGEQADRQAEYIFLQEQIKSYHKEHPDKTQAVLTRTNGLLESYLPLAGKGKNPVWEDMAAYLSFINCGRKREDFLKIMNKPMRYIGRNVLMEPVVNFKRLKDRLADKPWIQRRAADLERQIEFAAGLDLVGQLHYIWKAIGYGQYAGECPDAYPGKAKENAYWLQELLNVAKGCDGFIELKAVMGKREEENDGMGERVHMLTYHGAKGLEFDRVYLPDLNYGRVPHGRMLTKEELEEERRMFYVALTRAKESLVLLHVKGQADSPFLSEIE